MKTVRIHPTWSLPSSRKRANRLDNSLPARAWRDRFFKRLAGRETAIPKADPLRAHGFTRDPKRLLDFLLLEGGVSDSERTQLKRAISEMVKLGYEQED